jgi:TolB-like protein
MVSYIKNKKADWSSCFLLCGVFAFLLGIAGCATTTAPTQPDVVVKNETGAPPRRPRPNTAEPTILKQAVPSIVEEIEEALAQKHPKEEISIAVLEIVSSWGELSAWIRDELETDFSNGGVLKVVDKKMADKVRGELTEQNSGFVSIEDAQRMGKETGAQYIVAGDLVQEAVNFRLRISLTEIESNTREMTPTRYVIEGDPEIQPYLEKEKQQKELAKQRQAEEQERIRRAEDERRKEADRLEKERKEEAERQAEREKEEREREHARVAWKRKWLYFGLRGGASYRYYKMSEDDFDPDLTEAESGFPYEIAAHVALQFSPLLALQVEGIYTYDTVEYSGIDGPFSGSPASKNFTASFDSSSVMIPVLLKIQGRPDIFKISIFAGGYYVYRRGQMEYNLAGDKTEYDYEVPFGFVAGMDFGFKVGPGVLFFDGRFAIDCGKTSIQDTAGKSLAVYDRMMGSFTVGYELGLFEKSDWRDYEGD